MTIVVALLVLILALALLAVLVGLFLSRLYHKVPQGVALVVSTMRTVQVSFTGQVVLPVVHKAETMDISVKTIEIDRRGKEGLICQDNIRADIRVNFFVRVNKAEEDVIKVAQAIGCTRASDIRTLEELFAAKFAEALKTVGKAHDFVALYTERRGFRDAIIEVIGTDLNGYALEDVAIDFLEQTPLTQLDRDNILDAQGIRKITELTAIEHVATNVASNDELKQITAKNVQTREATLELERQQADAEARQTREIATVRSREQAAAAQVEAEERLKAGTAQIDADQKLEIQRENMRREIEVATKNRERVIAVESERVEKARMVEAMSRQVETTAAEKGLEAEKQAIAELRRTRVAVEKTVAEQEESIATLKVVEDANRNKQAIVILAEGDAQSALVRDIKAAEAAEQAAQHQAREAVVRAKADLEAADLGAQAKMRTAEGVRAETAAPGLAEVEVKEAEAAAIEKVGLAQVRVRQAEADAITRTGEAEAAVVQAAGLAEAAATEAKLKGEAVGLTEKAAAMRELEGVGQDFEQFVRQLEARTKVQLAEVDASIGIAKAQAEAVAAGLSNADIDIVGGADMFVDRMMGAVANGKSVDKFVDASHTAGSVLKPYLDGDGDLIQALAGALGGMGAEGVRDLTLAAFLGRLMGGSSEHRDKVGLVLEALAAQGLDGVPVRDLLGK